MIVLTYCRLLVQYYTYVGSGVNAVITVKTANSTRLYVKKLSD